MNYQSTYNQSKKKRSKLGIILHLILILITILLSVALFMAYFATKINPNSHWIFAFFGLAAPFLFLGNFVVLLIWLIRWNPWVILPLVTILCGVGYLGDLIRLRLSKEYVSTENIKHSKNEILVMTYNVHGFRAFKAKEDQPKQTIDSISEYIRLIDPDIVCMQEVQLLPQKGEVEQLRKQTSQYKYQVHSYLKNTPFDKWGVSILSKYPIIRAKAIKFGDQENSSLYADILFRGDTIRVFNNHLQTTSYNRINPKGISALTQDDDANIIIRSIGSGLKRNFKIRASQVDTISALIQQSPYPVFVMGDFNDTPVSYTYSKMRGDLNDTFVDKGSGYEYTYKPLFKLFRIDYIMHSDQFETMTHDSPYTKWSDHKPVISRMKYIPSQTKTQ